MAGMQKMQEQFSARQGSLRAAKQEHFSAAQRY